MRQKRGIYNRVFYNSQLENIIDVIENEETTDSEVSNEVKYYVIR